MCPENWNLKRSGLQHAKSFIKRQHVKPALLHYLGILSGPQIDVSDLYFFDSVIA